MTSVASRRQAHDSGDYSDASHPEIEQDNSGNDAGQQESDYESQGSDSERSDRDPDNQETERRVDDDEDRSNPQYIPKRGTFYEHDDRTAASGEELASNTTSETASEKKEGSETAAERRRPPRKSETINKWSHDKFNENEQAPKSRDELVAIYGYDIRNEDAPPHARRNRRYGRGPNKYTRTWEDEEAYKRQQAAPPRKPPAPEDFPDLDAANSYKKRVPRPRSKSQPSSIDSDSGSLRRNASVKTRKPARPRAKPREEKLPAIENLTITATVFNNSQSPPQRKVNATVAQQRPVPTEQGKKKPAPAQPSPPQNNGPPPKPPQQQQSQQNQQQTGPGAEGRGSKRYSSLRQRPLDTYAPNQPNQPNQPSQNQQNQPNQPPNQQNQQQSQQHRYHAEYGSGASPAQHQGSPGPQIHPQQIMQQMHRPAVSQHGPSPPHQPLPQQPQQLPQQQLPQQQLPQQQLQQQQLPQQQLPQQQLPQQQLPQQQLPQQQLPQQHSQQVRLGIMEQQQLVSHPHHSIHNMPQPHNMGQLQPTQGYAPPAMMPAQYMQGGGGAVFGGAALFAGAAGYPHQLYPHHNYVGLPVSTQPHDNYVNLPQASSAGGVTYYRCAEQERPAPARRPTAAIPIVRPARDHDRPANTSDKDNIDRIVENMFVRKPWPASHSADASKEKSESRNSQEPAGKETQETTPPPNDTKKEKEEKDLKEESQDETEEIKKDTEEVKEAESIDA